MPKRLPGMTLKEHQELSAKFKQMKKDARKLVSALGGYYGWTAKETRLAGKVPGIYDLLAGAMESRACRELRDVDPDEIKSLY